MGEKKIIFDRGNGVSRGRRKADLTPLTYCCEFSLSRMVRVTATTA